MGKSRKRIGKPIHSFLPQDYKTIDLNTRNETDDDKIYYYVSPTDQTIIYFCITNKNGKVKSIFQLTNEDQNMYNDMKTIVYFSDIYLIIQGETLDLYSNWYFIDIENKKLNRYTNKIWLRESNDRIKFTSDIFVLVEDISIPTGFYFYLDEPLVSKDFLGMYDYFWKIETIYITSINTIVVFNCNLPCLHNLRIYQKVKHKYDGSSLFEIADIKFEDRDEITDVFLYLYRRKN